MDESRWRIIESCTILTTTPNPLVADLHDRMPVIVPPGKYDLWLDPDVNDFEAIRDIFKPYDANVMRRYPVSRKLNNSKMDDAESASRVTLDTPSPGAVVLAERVSKNRWDDEKAIARIPGESRV
jgi:putative SOS response-associated peptidase YedK